MHECAGATGHLMLFCGLFNDDAIQNICDKCDDTTFFIAMEPGYAGDEVF
jgi:hypothetical protein